MVVELGTGRISSKTPHSLPPKGRRRDRSNVWNAPRSPQQLTPKRVGLGAEGSRTRDRSDIKPDSPAFASSGSLPGSEDCRSHRSKSGSSGPLIVELGRQKEGTGQRSRTRDRSDIKQDSP
jgi:hypothetical protein